MWVLFHFFETPSPFAWPAAWSLPGPQAPALPGGDLSDGTCLRGLSAREHGGAGSRGRNEVSMPFPLALEVHCIQATCSVSNINETGFYNQPKGNFMRRNRKTLKFIIYSLENKFVIVLSFLPDINLAVANIKKPWDLALRFIRSALSPAREDLARAALRGSETWWTLRVSFLWAGDEVKDLGLRLLAPHQGFVPCRCLLNSRAHHGPRAVDSDEPCVIDGVSFVIYQTPFP